MTESRLTIPETVAPDAISRIEGVAAPIVAAMHEETAVVEVDDKKVVKGKVDEVDDKKVVIGKVRDSAREILNG